ncbi:unnamed protein product [Caenorhabditis angaria]|uniref:Uncharacterized protein n=1 Tax=Caenorhabditis angaria TaxID=860376 RepID=A0A9P1I6N4_9PELO|nr:unnamed protein product [Caenorhabditis angaria]
MISNALRYPRICKQHFEDTKTIPIANLKDINLLPCCMYCNNSQIPPCLDIVTIPGSSVEARKWRKYFGIRSRKTDLYICLKNIGKV